MRQNRHRIGLALTTLAALGMNVARPGIAAAQDGILAIPAEPSVKPEINFPAELDTNRNGVDDLLERDLNSLRTNLMRENNPSMRKALLARMDARVRVELVFSRQITMPQINAFLALGGRIEHLYKEVSYGWNGSLPLKNVEMLPRQMGPTLVSVVAERQVTGQMDMATRTGRVRPVWRSGFAGRARGYSGSSDITIGILDTGIDDSHSDLTGRMEFWKDYTGAGIATPRDFNGHGSHVAGIALGTGESSGASTATLFYTELGNLAGAPAGNGFFSPLLLDGAATFHSRAAWIGGGSADLAHVLRPIGTSGSLTLISAPAHGPSPLSENNAFTALAGNQHGAFLAQNAGGTVGEFAIASDVTHSGVGDGFNTFRGVAPLCRWAGGKVLGDNGSGSTQDIKAALDDMVVQRIAHKIKVVNMSLGGVNDSTLRDKVNTLVSKGVLVVVSAGNSGGAVDITDPGRAGKAMTVAASNDINQLTSYTSRGFTPVAVNEDRKPDIMAPGGSAFFSGILSVDSNDGDSEDGAIADQQANDYRSLRGTSMASPFAAGAAALVIQALEESGTTWSFVSSKHPLLVKMLLCMTATESNAPREAGSGNNPTLGRATAPKDPFEGFGMLNPDAAIEAVRLDLDSIPHGPFDPVIISDSTSGGVFDRRAWAGHKSLTAGVNYAFTLDVPSTGDFDLYLYSAKLGSNGNPVIRRASAHAGSGVDETILYKPSAKEEVYLVVKRVSGKGAWKLKIAP